LKLRLNSLEEITGWVRQRHPTSNIEQLTFAFPTPPLFRCPTRDDRFAICGQKIAKETKAGWMERVVRAAAGPDGGRKRNIEHPTSNIEHRTFALPTPPLFRCPTSDDRFAICGQKIAKETKAVERKTSNFNFRSRPSPRRWIDGGTAGRGLPALPGAEGGVSKLEGLAVRDWSSALRRLDFDRMRPGPPQHRR
jgi:hypothetical protein